MDDLGTVFRGSWGGGCWCMHPRLTDAQTRELPGQGPVNRRRREAMTKLARRRRAPGLLGFEDDTPVGWIAIAPRKELARIEASRATSRVDDEDVWVIPCVTVHKTARGRGIALALIRAAVAYALGPRCSRGGSVPARGCPAHGRRQCLLRNRAVVPSRGVPGGPKAAEKPPAQLGSTRGHAYQDVTMKVGKRPSRFRSKALLPDLPPRNAWQQKNLRVLRNLPRPSCRERSGR